MRNKFTIVRSACPLFAGIALALAFTYGCSSDDNNNGNGGGDSSNSTPSNAVYGADVTYGGETYKTVVIGTQIWMARNLNYAVEGSRCYGEVNYGEPIPDSEIQANCTQYGRLYDWATAMGIDKEYNEKEWGRSDIKHQGICPDGWYLPSNADWDKLYRYVDGTSGTRSPYDSPTAGRYLKATSGWNSGGNGEDKFGFAALPGGRNRDYDFEVGYFGYWWSSSEDAEMSRLERFEAAYHRTMYYDNDGASWDSYYGSKRELLSVRCVQDNTGNSSPSGSGSSSSSLGSSSSSVTTSGSGSSSSGGVGGGGSYTEKGNDIASYRTKQIGDQTWMAENLNYAVEGSRCYGEGGYVYNVRVHAIILSDSEIQANCDKYGRLYDYATAMALPSKCNSVLSTSDADCAITTPNHRGICPSGWHISSNADWNVLMKFVESSCSDNSICNVGTELKATSGWNDSKGESDNGTDEFGFAALPGGINSLDGAFHDDGRVGVWWSASEDNANEAYGLTIFSFILSWDPLYKKILSSVRCVKD